MRSIRCVVRSGDSSFGARHSSQKDRQVRVTAVKTSTLKSWSRPRGGAEDPKTMGGRDCARSASAPEARCFPCASHEPRVAILAKAGCRRGCLVHGSLPMPILIPFGHPPAYFSSTSRLSRPSLRARARCFVLDRSLLRGRVSRSRSQESFRRRTCSMQSRLDQVESPELRVHDKCTQV